MARTVQQEVLTDHDEIREWAEQRNASPACVRGTGGRGDTGMLRLDFPGYSGETSLEHIDWDEWFQKFDEKNLALLVEGEGGSAPNFNKLVSRATANGGRSRSRASGRGGAAKKAAGGRKASGPKKSASAKKSPGKKAAATKSSAGKKTAGKKAAGQGGGAKKAAGRKSAAKKTGGSRGGSNRGGGRGR
ncbi:MAG TPA: hypothetical protein VFA04_08950 [Bryobacteraceae bacterium]|nr:hypothetical protein [Bryobacteraceae bacterium]